MSQRQIALARSLPILIMTLLCGTAILFLALRTIRGVNRSEALVERFESLSSVCNGQGAPAAAPFSPGEETYGAVAFRQSGDQWLLDPSAVPGDWQPQEVSQVQLVLCLDSPQPLSAERCQAGENGSRATRLYGEAVTARLLTAAQAELVASGSVESAPDPGCWSEEEPDTAPTSVSSGQLREWLVLNANAGR